MGKSEAVNKKEIFVSVKDFAKFNKKTERAIQIQISKGKLPAIKEASSCGGRSGIVYKIPLSALPHNAKRRYLMENYSADEVLPVALDPAPVDKPKKDFADFTAEERKTIATWMQIIKEWRSFRNNYGGKKTDANEAFALRTQKKHKDLNISIGILYAKAKAIKEDNLEALVDNRNKWKKGMHDYPSDIREMFEFFFLDESQHHITKCREYVNIWVEEVRPELLPQVPSYNSFVRMAKDIPVPYVKYFREGEKAYRDDCLPYITRIYEDLESNDTWVTDGHTFDVMTRENGTEKIHRLHLVAFVDVRSRKYMGWHVTPTLTAEAVLIALRKGIMEFGVPRNILADNGREFVCYDIGGRGHRKTASVEFTPTPAFERLGIKFLTAEVRNAKAKVIERDFREVKDGFSRLFPTYTGGNVLEKPDRLKKVLKKGNVIYDDEFIEFVDTWIRGYWNMKTTKGAGMNGKSPDQVYAENLITKRTTTKENLDLLLMRSTRAQRVQRKGVRLQISGVDIFYQSEELYFGHFNQKVFLRYDPEDLTSVRLYDLDERYLMTVPAASELVLSYGADKESIKTAKRTINRYFKGVKSYHIAPSISEDQKIQAGDLVFNKAKRDLGNIIKPQAKIIEPIKVTERSREQEELKAAVGGDEVIFDLKKMIRNAKIQNGWPLGGE